MRYMFMHRLYILFFLTYLTWTACINAPDFDDTPTLTYVGMSKTAMVQNELGRDSIILQLQYTDGDGNVGVEDGAFDKNVIVRDSRFNEIYAQFSTPIIPQQGANNGIDVDLSLLILNDCCLYPPEDSIPACSQTSRYPTNEFFFSITIEDQDGNISNEVQTDLITLQCIR